MSFSQKQHKDNLEDWSASKYAELGGIGQSLSNENVQLEYIETEDGVQKYEFLNLNSYFDVRAKDNIVYTAPDISPGDFWTPFEGFTCSEEYDVVSIYSKVGLDYPYFGVRDLELPTEYSSGDLWFGFERGGGLSHGHALFNFDCDGNILYCGVGGYSGSQSVEVQDLIPTGLGDKRSFFIQVTKHFVEFYVGDSCVAIFNHNVRGRMNRTSGAGDVDDRTVPYVRGLDPKIPKKLNVILEWSGVPEGESRTVKIADRNTGGGSLIMPLRYGAGAKNRPNCLNNGELQKYETAEPFYSGDITSDEGSRICHTVPVPGAKDKTLLFRISESATLDIYGITAGGSRRLYSSQSLSADTDEWVNLDGKFPYLEVELTPDAYPCTVNEAQIYTEGA